MDGGATCDAAVTGVMEAMLARLRCRGPRAIDVVDQRPLFGGAVVHVIDVDGRRLVFAVSGAAISLLARYASPARDRHAGGRRAPRCQK